MLTIEKAMHACMWFCSYSYGALVDRRLALQRCASKGIVVNNKHKLRLSFFFQLVYHKCLLCSKRFLRHSHRDRHMRSHTDEKPFSCQECGKRFSRRLSLTRHAETHGKSKYLLIIWHWTWNYISRKNGSFWFWLISFSWLCCSKLGLSNVRQHPTPNSLTLWHSSGSTC